MKPNLIAATLLLGISTCYAQVPAGSILLRGGLCFDQDKSANYNYDINGDFYELESRYTETAIKVGGGYAFTNNQVVGLNLKYKTSTDVGESLNFSTGGIITMEDKLNSFSVEPMYRYYHPCSENAEFSFIGQASVPFVFTSGSNSIEYSDGPNPPSTEVPDIFGMGVEITPYFAWFPSENWSLEASFGKLGFFTESYEVDGTKLSSTDLTAKLWMFRPRLSFAYYF